MRFHSHKHNVLPGFGLALGYSLLYLGLIVLLPLSALFFRISGLGWACFWEIVTTPRVLASYRLTIGTAFIAAGTNAVFGLIVAWTLVRYTFPGRRFIDALVDLPFALPTAVSGIALTAVYSEEGWIGKHLASIGIKAAFTPLGIILALTFIGLPFVVRTVQPALEDLDAADEEAAASLGASRLQTFCYVIIPTLFPALLTGFSLSFARGLGEYGAVVFISGNMPFQTEFTSLLIVSKLEQHDTAGATALAVVMLLISFAILLVINAVQWWTSSRLREDH